MEKSKNLEELLKNMEKHPCGCPCVSHYIVKRLFASEALLEHRHDEDVSIIEDNRCEEEKRLEKEWRDSI